MSDISDDDGQTWAPYLPLQPTGTWLLWMPNECWRPTVPALFWQDGCMGCFAPWEGGTLPDLLGAPAGNLLVCPPATEAA